MKDFRELRADEIEVRAQSVSKSKNGIVGVILLLYKDARSDMNILDDTVGGSKWERHHEIIGNNLYCTVSIYDEDLCQWVSKQDVGTESNTEAEKGQASDSFKRACVNWGIGRELYTAPFTYVQLKDGEYYEDKTGKPRMNFGVKFSVSEIEYTKRKITKLILIDNNGEVRFTYPQPKAKKGKLTKQKEAPQENLSALDLEKQIIEEMGKMTTLTRDLSSVGVDVRQKEFSDYVDNLVGINDHRNTQKSLDDFKKVNKVYEAVLKKKKKEREEKEPYTQID